MSKSNKKEKKVRSSETLTAIFHCKGGVMRDRRIRRPNEDKRKHIEDSQDTEQKMTWKLWLDDQSHEENMEKRHAPEGFIPAISSNEAIAMVIGHGMPEYVDFDHDLGGDDNAMLFLNWLDRVYFEDITMVKPFQFSVHSANPIGMQNIESFMGSWEKMWLKNQDEKI